MDLIRIAMKDLLRRRGKSLYLLTAVVIPVAILSTVLLTLDNADTTLSTLASKFGFTLSIQPKNIKPDRIDQIGVVLDDTLEEALLQLILERIRAQSADRTEMIITSPRLYEKTELHYDNRTISGIVAGLDFVAERQARPSLALSSGRWPNGPYEVVAGGTFGRTNRLTPQREVEIAGQRLMVTGVMENYNSSDDHMVFVPLRTAQKLFGKDVLVSLINNQSVGLDRNQDLLKKVTAALNSEIPSIRAISPQQFTTLKFVLLKKTFKFLLAIVLATVIVSIFSIFNIVTTVLYSRVREIGLLKAVGASRQQLLTIFLYEYLSIGLVGGVAGYLLGIGFTYTLDTFLLKLGSSVSFHIPFFMIALMIGMLCSLTASTYPTFKLSRIKITESFRSQWEV